MTTIYVGGSFDLFHVGHVRLLQAASEIADKVVVAVNSDAFFESYKGFSPTIPEHQRLEIVLSCRYVTYAFLMHRHEDQRRTIRSVKPTYILHGDDWTGDSLLEQLGIDHEFLRANHIEMKYVPYTSEISSSEIRKRIK